MEALTHTITIIQTAQCSTNANNKLSWIVDLHLDGELLHKQLTIVDPFTQAKHQECHRKLEQLLAKLQALEIKISDTERRRSQRAAEAYATEEYKLHAAAMEGSVDDDDYQQDLFCQLQLPMNTLNKRILLINICEQYTENSSPNGRTINVLHWEHLEASEIWKQSSVLDVVVRRVVPQCRTEASLDPSSKLWTQKTIPRSTNNERKHLLNVLLVIARDTSETPHIRYREQYTSWQNTDRVHWQDTDPSLAQLAILQVRERLRYLKCTHRIRLTIVRPGTFEALEEILQKTTETYGPGYFSIVHFDVHGHVSANGFEDGLKHTAWLQFASPDLGTLRKRSALDVARLINRHGIPCAVINACKSATANRGINANLSRVFNQAGIANVVAMSQDFTSYASDVFQRSFYEAFLLTLLPFSKAAAIARKCLRASKLQSGRRAAGVRIQDWSVPVVYTAGKDVQVVLSEDREPRLSWPLQLPGTIIQSKRMTLVRRRIPALRHRYRNVAVMCAAISQTCVSEYQQRSTSGLLKLPSSIIRSIKDDIEIPALDIDTLKLEQGLVEDPIVILHGITSQSQSVKLQRMARLWLTTGFVDNAFYVKAHQFLYHSSHTNTRLKQQGTVLCCDVAKIYALMKSMQESDSTSGSKAVIIIDLVDALFPSSAKLDKQYLEGQRRFKDFLSALPKKTTSGRYPTCMPYLILTGKEDVNWWDQKLEDLELDTTYQKAHQTASYRRIV